MRSLVVVLCVSLGLAGCRVCSGACAKTHGRAVTAIVPNPDGTIKVTTCTLTTKGTSAKVDACQDSLLPAPTKH